MQKIKRFFGVMAAIFFVFNVFMPSTAFSQAVLVMTLADGTPISMTSAQLSALSTQSGITLSSSAAVGATQIAIPLPSALGGGYIIGAPSAIAGGMGATGIATVSASALVGATAAAGTIAAGTLAGTVATLGTGGTIATGAAVTGGIVGGIVGATGGDATTTHHHH
ncbi:MAG: hypothetical protein HY756_07305 [Nitrospirae bacterium]|nr:hypothetical protein [Nitrospirota bacterium]